MPKIHIKMLSLNALNYIKKNIKYVTEQIKNNDNNMWIYNEFPNPIFVEKKFEIEDFELINNPGSKDKNIDFKNSKAIYESCKELPRYILTDECFWLWLHFEKFYSITKNMMQINGESTVKDHWLHTQGTRRGLMFGVLSRCYFRVELSIDEQADDPYELTKFVIENPIRFREFTWRAYSSQKHIIRGILRGEKRAIEETGNDKNVFDELAKYISFKGSVMLIDAISEEDIEEITYNKMMELLK